MPPFRITIDQQRQQDPLSDEGESSADGVHSSPSGEGSNEFTDNGSEGYVHVDRVSHFDEDIEPSESASRPHTSHRHRVERVIEERRPPPVHRSSSQRHPPPAEPRPYASRMQRPPPPPPESVASSDDYLPYPPGHGPPPGRAYRPSYGPPPDLPHGPYPPSAASGPSYHGYPGNSMVPMGGGNQLVQYGGQGPYGGYFPPGHGGQYGNALATRPGGHPGQGPFGQEMMPFGGGAPYYYNPQGYGMGMGSPIIYSYPPDAESPSNDASREDILRLEKLIIDHRREDELKARRAADEKAAAEKKAAEEDAIAAAKAEVAKATAAAAAAASPPEPKVEEKKKPIRFKDAINRKFSFPFHLCQKWEGMEALIKQAFMHVDMIGSHVIEGHYDLIGPDGEIILPQVWETMIEPDWSITMKMWPIPEPPKPPPEPVPAKEDEQQVVMVEPGAPPTIVKSPPPGGAAGAAAPAPGGPGVPPPPPPAPGAPPGGLPPGVTIVGGPAPGGGGGGGGSGSKSKQQPAQIPSFLMWTAGGNRARSSKKAVAKPERAVSSVEHDVVCRVM